MIQQRLTALVCDDHPLFRAGVVACITEDRFIEVVGEASDGEACIAKLEIFDPDILVVDLSLPSVDGFEVLEWIRSNKRSVRSFVVSMHTDIEFVQKAIQLGAGGFIAKEDAQSELLSAIRQNMGEFYTSESVGRRSVHTVPGLGDPEFARKLKNVSSAEMKVLTLLTRSMTSREIAEALHISVRTVQAHRVNLAAKFEVKGPNKLLELAIRYRTAILEASSAA